MNPLFLTPKTSNNGLDSNGTIHKPDENGRSLICSHGMGGFRMYRAHSEPLVPEEAISVFIKEDVTVTIKELLNVSFDELKRDEIKTYALFNFFLSTIALLTVKLSSAGNVMFLINGRGALLVGLYGNIANEETKPEPLAKNIPSYTCFRGFALEDEKWVGVPVSALSHSSIQFTCGGYKESDISICLHIPLELSDSLVVFDEAKFAIIEKRGDTLFCQWLMRIPDAGEEIEKIVNVTGKTMEELHSIHRVTLNYLHTKHPDERSRNLNSLYSSYDTEGDSIVFY